jgi:hypothetical protein
MKNQLLVTKLFIWRMFKEEHPYRRVTSQVKKFGADALVHAIPLNFKLRPWV